MNEEELKKQIKQEIKQELKKEQKKKRIIILSIILVIIAVMSVTYIRYDIQRQKRNEEYRIQEEQREQEQKQKEYEILRIEIPANINWYKGQLDSFKKRADKIIDKHYIKEGYEEFKRYIEANNKNFTEEERRNAEDVIKQYEETIKKYNIK